MTMNLKVFWDVKCGKQLIKSRQNLLPQCWRCKTYCVCLWAWIQCTIWTKYMKYVH